MRLLFGSILAAGVIGVATPAPARATELHLLHSSLDGLSLASKAPLAMDLPLHLDTGSGGDTDKMSPWLPWALSFLLPGVGQFVNGQVGKGVLMLVGYIVLYGVGEALTTPNEDGSTNSLALVGLVAYLADLGDWIWSWIDAYSTRKAMNGGAGGEVRPEAIRPPMVAAADAAMARGRTMVQGVQLPLGLVSF